MKDYVTCERFRCRITEKLRRVHTGIWRNSVINSSVNAFTVKPFGKKAERGRAHVVKSVSLGLTFDEIATECCFQDW